MTHRIDDGEKKMNTGSWTRFCNGHSWMHFYSWASLLWIALFTMDLMAQDPRAADGDKSKFDLRRVDNSKEHFGGLLKEGKIKMDFAETDHLLVFTDLGSTETAAVAELAQKSFLSSCRLLQIDSPEELFENKVTVVVLNQDGNFDSLQKAMFETKLTAGRSVLWRIEGPRPCILVTQLPSATNRSPAFSANWAQFTSRFIGTTVLLRRYPEDATHARLPVWIRDGFGLYASLLAKDNPEAIRVYRDQFRQRIKDNTEMFDFSLPNEGFYNYHVTSVVEFVFAFMDSGQFDALVQALQKQRVVRDKRISGDVLMILKWNQVELQRQWRYFAKFGKRLAR